MPWFGPWALIGLLYTIVVMFASQVAGVIAAVVAGAAVMFFSPMR
jgi:ACR3 family arsenite efflux pump ArsB